MPETVQKCPLCASTQSRLFDRRSFRGQAVANRVCAVCGLVYQSPRMTAAELDGFYEEEYRQLYQGSAGPDAKDLAVQRGRAQALLAFAQDGMKTVSRHLDIGCSAGLLLEAFKEAYDSTAVGIEPGVAYRQYACERGFRVYADLEELRAAGEDSFDLVSMAHVLEHLPDPVGYLQAVRRDLISENGRLLVEVPNLYVHDSFETAHLVSYSAHSLVQVFEKAGFETLYYQEHGRPRSDLLPLYITALARPAGDGAQPFQLRPEKRVKLKRRMGLLRRSVLSRLYPRRAWIPISRIES